jgi:uncharacterized protein
MKRSVSLIFVNLLFAAFAFSQAVETPINAIQGTGGDSPKVGTQVTTHGIVTAIVYKKGFYIQTPDAEVDKISKTSEGVFVLTKEDIPVDAVIGNLVKVSGKVAEFKRPADKYSLKSTQIVFSSIEVISKGNPLPEPYILTAIDLDPSGTLDQIERFEGMRVKINALTTTGGTGGRVDENKGFAISDGVFFGVLKGVPRPFREPGIEGLQWLLAKMDKTLPVFDTNPEMLRIDSYAQAGAKKIEVTAGATVKNLIGVIDYYKGSYTVLVDANNPPTVEGNKVAVPVAAAKEREITVASFNLENFFDDEKNSDVEKEIIKPKKAFEGRLQKASLAIRNVLMMPDVLGVIEVENIIALKKLADKINADAIAAKQSNPNYVPYLEEGNDIRGIDVGYLIKSSRVKVVEIKQLAKDVKLDVTIEKPKDDKSGDKEDDSKDEKADKSDDDDNKGGRLFDRPSLLLRASVDDKGKSFEFTVIINHLKSFIGVDDLKKGEATRNKRRLQSEWLASFLQDRAKTNQTERMILCGDFNAFEFSDGFNDLIGTLIGKPSPNVVTPSKIVFQTGLVDLITALPKSNRYSYVHDGNAQVIDHFLINPPAFKNAVKFDYARLDADFPYSYYNDTSRPERVSDHDGAILYLSLDDNKK